jgi:hypothetical protein
MPRTADWVNGDASPATTAANGSDAPRWRPGHVMFNNWQTTPQVVLVATLFSFLMTASIQPKSTS